MKNEKIVIGVAMHNNASVIERCISSILKQKNVNRNIHIVVGNDNSKDDWRFNLDSILKEYKNQISIINLNNSCVVKTRNDINNYIIDNIENNVLIGRLDADDEYADENVLSIIETIYEIKTPDLILAGNYLRTKKGICNRVNRSTKRILDYEYLKNRVYKMSKGIEGSELPSCNLFIKPNCLMPYPEIESGEDHLLLINYLINRKKYNWYFAEELLAVIYNLEGTGTSSNKRNSFYFSSREKMLNKIKAC